MISDAENCINIINELEKVAKLMKVKSFYQISYPNFISRKNVRGNYATVLHYLDIHWKYSMYKI